MLTCLVLVEDPSRCSECRKKIEIIVIENKTDKLNVDLSPKSKVKIKS